MVWLVCIAVATLLIWIMTSRKSALSGIPGPPGIPLLGNVSQLNPKDTHIQLSRWGKQYGELFRISMVGEDILIAGSPQAIHQVQVQEGKAFAGRMSSSYRAFLTSKGWSDILATDWCDEVRWRRKFLHNHLKQYGAGMKVIEGLCHDAFRECIQKLEEEAGQCIDIQDEVHTAIANIMCVSLLGKKLSEPKICEIKDIGKEIFESEEFGPQGLLLDWFPFLRFFGNASYKLIMRNMDLQAKVVQEWITDCKNDIDRHGLIHKILDADTEDKAHLNDDVIQLLMIQSFLAGTNTTHITLCTLINVLVHYPHVQQSLQKEVDDVVGRDKDPDAEDRISMPYHQATLLEIGRFASIGPIGLPHKTQRPTKLCGYDIPVNCQVWCNLWGLHHSEVLWSDPHLFNPGRFLDAEGQLVAADHPNRFNMRPFGSGTRGCMGEMFAHVRMFIFLAMMMKTFTILPKTTLTEQPSCAPESMVMGSLLMPQPFKVRLQKRTTQ